VTKDHELPPAEKAIITLYVPTKLGTKEFLIVDPPDTSQFSRDCDPSARPTINNNKIISESCAGIHTILETELYFYCFAVRVC